MPGLHIDHTSEFALWARRKEWSFGVNTKGRVNANSARLASVLGELHDDLVSHRIVFVHVREVTNERILR